MILLVIEVYAKDFTAINPFILSMGVYTIINITGEFESDDLKMSNIINGIGGNNFSDMSDGLAVARYGKDRVEEVFETLVDEKNGKLLYDYPISKHMDTGEMLGYLLIDLYEDTGDSHETFLYRVFAFAGAELVDKETFIDDYYGDEVERYYRTRHDLDARIVTM